MKILSFIFGTIVAIIAILLIVSSFPITGNYKLFIVQSGSMEPKIMTGSLVAVKPAPSYVVGDVITFGPVPKGKLPTTHRIIEARTQSGLAYYTTKGDANNSKDAKEVLSKDIMGKVLIDVPYVGYVLAAAKTRIGFTILIIVPALILLFDETKRIVVEIRKIRNKRRGRERISEGSGGVRKIVLKSEN